MNINLIICGFLAVIFESLLHYLADKIFCARNIQSPSKPFLVSEYCERIEQATLEMVELREPVSQTIILWWGLDGLTTDENGVQKWISRANRILKSNQFSSFPCENFISANCFMTSCTSCTILYADNRPVAWFCDKEEDFDHEQKA